MVILGVEGHGLNLTKTSANEGTSAIRIGSKYANPGIFKTQRTESTEGQ